MGLGKITVDTQQLRSASTTINSKAQEYQGLYGQLYSLVEELQGAWSGTDNTAFTTQIEGFKDDFDYMHQLMIDYANSIQKAAETYEQTQEQIANDAKNLKINR